MDLARCDLQKSLKRSGYRILIGYLFEEERSRKNFDDLNVVAILCNDDPINEITDRNILLGRLHFPFMFFHRLLIVRLPVFSFSHFSVLSFPVSFASFLTSLPRTVPSSR